jgi:hypothetical protein
MRADPEQHVAQIFDGVDVVGLAGGDEGVKASDVVASILVEE